MAKETGRGVRRSETSSGPSRRRVRTGLEGQSKGADDSKGGQLSLRWLEGQGYSKGYETRDDHTSPWTWAAAFAGLRENVLTQEEIEGGEIIYKDKSGNYLTWEEFREDRYTDKKVEYKEKDSEYIESVQGHNDYLCIKQMGLLEPFGSAVRRRHQEE